MFYQLTDLMSLYLSRYATAADLFKVIAKILAKAMKKLFSLNLLRLWHFFSNSRHSYIV